MPGEGLALVDPVPGAAKPDPVLVLDSVQRRFDGLVAVDVDHLEVQRGTITALIGPNGAGKTTLFNVICGFDKADRGRWWVDGRAIHRRPAHRIARLGMVRTFQLTKALARLSVLDNVALAATGQRGERVALAAWRPLWRKQEAEVEARARQVLDRFGLAHMAREYAGTLSGGQRKLLELARALMVEPALVLLDEPVAGINPALVQQLLGHITGIRDEGRTVLFVEHNMDVVMGISDWVVCLNEGQVIAEGPPESVAGNQAVIDAYLGTRRA